MKILYFGGARDLAGVASETVEVEDEISSLAAALDWIRSHRPSMDALIASSGIRIAIDERVVGPQDRFPQPRTIAIFPPLSGG